MAARKTKIGFVYLLQSASSTSIFKYGCSTVSPESRCKKVNQDNKGLDFTVIACFKSFDIFHDEKIVKWDLFDSGAGFAGEIFDISETGEFETGQEVMLKFLMVGGVIK